MLGFYPFILFAFGACLFFCACSAPKPSSIFLNDMDAKLHNQLYNCEAYYKESALLGERLYYGRGMKKDEERGLELLQCAAQGNAHAQAILDIIIKDVRAKYARGNLHATYILGLILCRDGIFVADHEAKAGIKCWERAAARGYAPAQYQLVRFYCLGMNTEKDKEKALEFLQRAAANGHVKARFELGEAYYYGSDMKNNLPGRYSLQTVNNETKLTGIWSYYYFPQIVKNKAKGLKLLRSAAADGDGEAQRCLLKISADAK